jgi:uridine phosphorylase
MTSAQHNPAPLAAYLRPTAPIAAAALLPDDPGLALALAQATLDKPLMSNHHHGLWGYHGRDADGRELTVQATGIGAPSAAAVLRELGGLGVTRAVRVGRCAALGRGLAPGARVRAAGAVGRDGVSRALGVASATPDPDLDAALAAAIGDATPVTVAGYDLPAAAAAADARATWLEAGATVADLETAALLALGERLGIAIAACLVVAEGPDGQPADEQLVGPALLALAREAARALASVDAAVAER